MVYGKATSYSDYYKNKDNTPGDDNEEDGKSKPVIPTGKSPDMVAARKAALRRRLLNKKKVGL